jgi:hypothetical protein
MSCQTGDAMTTPDEKLQRELDLRYEIQRLLPKFAAACESDAEMVLMHQDAFAADLREDEFALLGRAIKFAGLLGKDVTITAKK